jgi:hypothetical protein
MDGGKSSGEEDEVVSEDWDNYEIQDNQLVRQSMLSPLVNSMR